jgi:hypothetical protein
MLQVMLLAGCAALALILLGRLYMQKQAEAKLQRERVVHQREFLLSQLDRVSKRVALDPKYASADGFAALGLAWSKKKLVLVGSTFHNDRGEKLPKPRVSIRVVDARDLIGSTILRDSYVKTNKTGGKRKEMCRGLDLKINVADPRDPVHLVRFVSEELPVTSVEYMEAWESIHRWDGVVTAMVYQAVNEPEVAARLTEIDLLRAQGVLSEDEFIRQKAQLLARQFMETGVPKSMSEKSVSDEPAKGAAE